MDMIKVYSNSVLVLLLFLMIFTPITNAFSVKTNIFKNKDLFKLEKEHSTDIVCVEGNSHYNFGFNIGRKYGFMYKSINFFTKLFRKENTNDDAELTNHVIFLKNSCPQIYQEIKGLSDAIGISVERIASLKKSLQPFLRHGCTVTASTGNATKNNETFLTQNMDLYRHEFKSFYFRLLFSKLWIPHLWVKKYKNFEYSYVILGIPIIAEKPLMNEKGLSLLGTDIAKKTRNETPADKGSGIPLWFWWPMIFMSCDDVYDVVDFYKGNLKPSTKLFNSDLWADSHGNIMGVEITNTYSAFTFSNSTEITGGPDSILWHTNHHIWLDPNLTGSLFPNEALSSKHRCERAKEILVENHGNITLDTCKMLCRDHGGGFKQNEPDSWDICCHSDIRYPGFTIKSLIIEPKKLTIHFTNFKPCLSRYKEFSFSEKFNV